jgi:hypothetical protein
MTLRARRRRSEPAAAAGPSFYGRIASGSEVMRRTRAAAGGSVL